MTIRLKNPSALKKLFAVPAWSMLRFSKNTAMQSFPVRNFQKGVASKHARLKKQGVLLQLWWKNAIFACC